MFIFVKVRPNSGRSELVVNGDNFIAFVKSLPEDNKANIEVMKLIQRKFKKTPVLIRGASSRNKVFRLD